MWEECPEKRAGPLSGLGREMVWEECPEKRAGPLSGLGGMVWEKCPEKRAGPLSGLGREMLWEKCPEKRGSRSPRLYPVPIFNYSFNCMKTSHFTNEQTKILTLLQLIVLHQIWVSVLLGLDGMVEHVLSLAFIDSQAEDVV